MRADFWRYYQLRWVGGRVAGWGLMEVSDLAAHLPAESATKRALGGGWLLDEQLAALVADRLQVLIWQKTGDGQKGKNVPKPIPRPGFEDDSKGTIRGSRMSVREAERWAKRRRAAQERRAAVVPAADGLVEYTTRAGAVKRVTPARAAAYERRRQ